MSMQFTRLSDAPLRDAWPDEARDFTPWLFNNLDFLSDALGMELEATDTEVAVDSFSADIIAKDSRTGDRVLIENQLEASDHRHLGQILTYLAGIEAKSIVWVAREFQEAHRSAIRWLNEHTDTTLERSCTSGGITLGRAHRLDGNSTATLRRRVSYHRGARGRRVTVIAACSQRNILPCGSTTKDTLSAPTLLFQSSFVTYPAPVGCVERLIQGVVCVVVAEILA